MTRRVSARLEVTVEEASRLEVQIGIAHPEQYATTETIAIRLDGNDIAWQEIAGLTGSRVWLFDAPAGQLSVSYFATIEGNAAIPDIGIDEQLLYRRASRYCESDRLIGFASRLFRDLDTPKQTLAAVSSWVGNQLEYISGSSGPTDGAIDTLLAAKGVCRDFGHLAVGLLRAVDIPARLVAVYAPGLQPMDFHAVAEAFVDGAWYVIDPTLLAPRQALVRIATGRDAADTSFLTSYGGHIVLEEMEVTATTDGMLPIDSVYDLVALR